jgi:hypothetical protein
MLDLSKSAAASERLLAEKFDNANDSLMNLGKLFIEAFNKPVKS